MLEQNKIEQTQKIKPPYLDMNTERFGKVKITGYDSRQTQCYNGIDFVNFGDRPLPKGVLWEKEYKY